MTLTPPAHSLVRSDDDATARVACTWQLVDMDPVGQSGMQYVDAVGLHDDNADTMPSRVGCAGDVPKQQESINRTIQVTANPNDDPGRRAIQLWSSINYETGIDTVGIAYWDVFYPDGSFKERVEARKASCSQHGIDTSADDADAGSMFAAAIGSGQMDAAAARALVARCAAGASGLYRGVVTLSATEPCGQYRVDAQAASAPGIDVLTSYFDNICVQHLAIDFDTIGWGQIDAGQTRVLQGDLSASTAAAPTANNRGSGGLNLGVAFSPMEPVNETGGPAGGAAITEFGAAFGVSSTALQALDTVTAGQAVWFDSAADQTLCTGETGRLDLMVHAPDHLAGGVYHGSIQVLGRPDTADGGRTCNNDKGVWGGEAIDGSNQRNAGVFVAAPAPIDVAQTVVAVGSIGSRPGSNSDAVNAAPAPTPSPVDFSAPPTDVLPTRGEGLALGSTVVEVLNVSLGTNAPLERGTLGPFPGERIPEVPGQFVGEAGATPPADDSATEPEAVGVIAAPAPIAAPTPAPSPSTGGDTDCGARLITQQFDIEAQAEIWTFLCATSAGDTIDEPLVADGNGATPGDAAPTPATPGTDTTPPPTAGTGAPPADDAPPPSTEPGTGDDDPGAPPTTEPPPTTTTQPPPPPEEKPFLIYAWLIIDDETGLALGYMYEFETEAGDRTEASLELLAYCDPLESWDEDDDGFNDGDVNENSRLDEGEEWSFTCSQDEIPPELLVPGVGTFINAP